MLNRRLIALVMLALMPRVHAGMTVYDLNDVVRLRLEDISFFVMFLGVSGLLIQFLWNVLARGVPSLPRLPYKQALALMVILSLGMLLVLSMISGARELLTPEAWRRQGSGYRLNAPENEGARLRNIVALKSALLEYAARNNGRFPAHDWGGEIPQKIWEAENGGTHFIYLGGFDTNAGAALIAAEPISFGESRYTLTANGEIRKVHSGEIALAMEKGAAVR